MAPKPTKKQKRTNAKKLFRDINRQRLLLEHHGVGRKEITKLLQNEWREAPQERKDKYILAAKRHNESISGAPPSSASSSVSSSSLAVASIDEDKLNSLKSRKPLPLLHVLIIGSDLTFSLSKDHVKGIAASFNPEERIALVKDILGHKRAKKSKIRALIDLPLTLKGPLLVKHIELVSGSLLHYAVASEQASMVSLLLTSLTRVKVETATGSFRIRVATGLAGQSFVHEGKATPSNAAGLETGNPIVLACHLMKFYQQRKNKSAVRRMGVIRDALIEARVKPYLLTKEGTLTSRGRRLLWPKVVDYSSDESASSSSALEEALVSPVPASPLSTPSLPSAGLPPSPQE